MNREYMEYMRANYADVVKQQFNQTVVKLDETSGSSAAHSSTASIAET